MSSDDVNEPKSKPTTVSNNDSTNVSASTAATLQDDSTSGGSQPRLDYGGSEAISRLLNDTNGTTCRGSFLTLADTDRKVLVMLYQAYEEVEKKKKLSVVSRSGNLFHLALEDPGFPVNRGDPFLALHTSWNVSQLEKDISGNIKRELKRMGYCSEKQEIRLYLSFMKSLENKVQDPHIDYKWHNIEPYKENKRRRGFRGNYNDWIPFIALFPVTSDGMTVEIWNARSEHEHPKSEGDKKGCLVHIPYGQMLLLRADVVHAGGFKTAPSGNPRRHFYVYKVPDGVVHANPLSNSYNIEDDNSGVELADVYKHWDHPYTEK